MTDELLTLVPNHNRAIGNRVYYLQDIAQKGLSKRKGEDGQEDSAVNAQVSKELVLLLKDKLLFCLPEFNFHFYLLCSLSQSVKKSWGMLMNFLRENFMNECVEEK